MTPTLVAVRVPVADRPSLDELREAAEPEAHIQESRSLDGDTLVTILLTLSPSTMLVLTTWIRNRAKTKRELCISFNGVELRGYTSDDAEEIIRTIGKVATQSKKTNKES